MAKKSKSTERYPANTLHYWFKQNKLWLNPEYQRESVWTAYQKQLLIDSILHDIDVPKLYFRKTNKNKYEFEVVDGQQRLRAIFEYIENDFALLDESDDVDGHSIKNLTFKKLHSDVQNKLFTSPLDVVIMNEEYSDEDIEEIFLRLQNGTPLNAAEKRRAIASNMRSVVHAISTDKVFELCSFKNKRYAFEDVVAKTLHLFLYGSITDIRPNSIKKTYEINKGINQNNTEVKKLKKVYSFVRKAFKKAKVNPRFKKYSLMSLSYLTAELLDKYNLADFPVEFAEAYIEFEQVRITNEDQPEDSQDPAMAAYTNAARADDIPSLRYRHEYLREWIIKKLPALVLKDPQRGFSEEQRIAIYRRDKGVCQMCGAHCDENNFHADHKKSHSKGGKTQVSNGQTLCEPCNLKKSNRP